MGAYHSSLDIGMTPDEYCKSTVGEVRDRIESYHRQQTAMVKQRAVMDYRMAALVSAACAGKMPPIHEAYPGMFDPPPIGQDWREAKARLLNFAAAHNRAMEVRKRDN